MVDFENLQRIGCACWVSVSIRSERIVVLSHVKLPGSRKLTLSKELEQLPYTDRHLQQVKLRYPNAQIREPRQFLS